MLRRLLHNRWIKVVQWACIWVYVGAYFIVVAIDYGWDFTYTAFLQRFPKSALKFAKWLPTFATQVEKDILYVDATAAHRLHVEKMSKTADRVKNSLSTILETHS